jgi:RNA polymerase sigma-70 factor (ECF subfamily)
METAATLAPIHADSVTGLTEHAFGEFYRQHSRPLWTYAYRVTGNAADADDIVQEAFCRLLRVEINDASDEALRRYVFRIAGNLMTDRWRRATRERVHVADVQDGLRTSTTPSHDEDVMRIFVRLKPRERALLWLAYVEGDDHQEIAESLGLARASIKVLLSRARARLRDLLTSKGLIEKM